MMSNSIVKKKLLVLTLALAIMLPISVFTVYAAQPAEFLDLGDIDVTAQDGALNGDHAISSIQEPESKATVSSLDQSPTSDVLRAPLPTMVSISGPPTVSYTEGTTVTYIVSVSNAPEITAIQLTLRVDSAFFDYNTASGVNGFENIGVVIWMDVGGGIYEGTIVLAGSGSGDIDIFEIEFLLSGVLGTTEVELIDFGMAYKNEWIDFEYGDAVAITSINESYSVYDLNHDGQVDLRDISIAMMYYMAEFGDANWDDALIADVNGDLIVDIDDLILIRTNYS